MQELISRMLDEELSAEEQAALAKHLESCPECRAMYEAFAAVSGALHEQLEEPPARLRENVMAEIRREQIRKKNRRPWRAALSVAAVAVLALGLRFGVGPRLTMGSMAASVQKFAVTEEAAESEAAEDAALGAAQEKAVLFDAAPAEAAGREAAAAPAQANAAASVQANAAAQDRAAAPETSPVLDLGSLRFEELLEKLDGVKVLLAIERLGDTPALTLRCADGELALFEYAGALYYYNVEEEALMRCSLTQEALRALAEG